MNSASRRRGFTEGSSCLNDLCGQGSPCHLRQASLPLGLPAARKRSRLSPKLRSPPTQGRKTIVVTPVVWFPASFRSCEGFSGFGPRSTRDHRVFHDLLCLVRFTGYTNREALARTARIIDAFFFRCQQKFSLRAIGGLEHRVGTPWGAQRTPSRSQGRFPVLPFDARNCVFAVERL
jgi:hypothetical protein